MADTVQRATGRAVAVYPIDADEKQDDLLGSIQAQHREFTNALGIAPPPDLQSYNLNDPSEWASWTWELSQDLSRLRLAAGIA